MIVFCELFRGADRSFLCHVVGHLSIFLVLC